MSKFIISGGQPLKGEIEVNGAKNSATKAIAAAILSNEEMVIENITLFEDVRQMLAIYRDLGGKVTEDASAKKVLLKLENLKKMELDKDLACKSRPSILFVGPLLSRFGEAKIVEPGGCAIGKRPIDLFINGFKAMGVAVTDNPAHNEYNFKGYPQGGTFIFPLVSVTATETLMLAAVLARGRTILKNVAQEPEIPALAGYLNNHGAKIVGAGTPVITIEGVEKITAGDFEVIPDRIEAGSYLAMAAATNGDLLVRKCQPKHLEVPLDILRQIGVKMEIGSDYVHVIPGGELKAIDIKTHEYPGFPTDLQPPFTVLLTQAQGRALVHETIYEGRMFYIDKINRMGADIILCDPHRAIVIGPTKLYGRELERSPDLRAGFAMVMAGLIAEGTTIIDNIYQIDRGYEHLEKRLRHLGAEIIRADAG